MGVRDWFKLREKAKLGFIDSVLGELISKSDSFVSIVRFHHMTLKIWGLNDIP